MRTPSSLVLLSLLAAPALAQESAPAAPIALHWAQDAPDPKADALRSEIEDLASQLAEMEGELSAIGGVIDLDSGVVNLRSGTGSFATERARDAAPPVDPRIEPAVPQERGYLGIEMGVGEESLEIIRFLPGSLADDAGLKVGDVITNVGKLQGAGLEDGLKSLRAGTTVDVQASRGDNVVRARVRLQTLPQVMGGVEEPIIQDVEIIEEEPIIQDFEIVEGEPILEDVEVEEEPIIQDFEIVEEEITEQVPGERRVQLRWTRDAGGAAGKIQDLSTEELRVMQFTGEDGEQYLLHLSEEAPSGGFFFAEGDADEGHAHEHGSDHVHEHGDGHSHGDEARPSNTFRFQVGGDEEGDDRPRTSGRIRLERRDSNGRREVEEFDFEGVAGEVLGELEGLGLSAKLLAELSEELNEGLGDFELEVEARPRVRIAAPEMGLWVQGPNDDEPRRIDAPRPLLDTRIRRNRARGADDQDDLGALLREVRALRREVQDLRREVQTLNRSSGARGRRGR